MDKNTIIIIALLLVCVVVAGYMLGTKSGANVPDFGKRADEARTDIHGAGEKQQLAADKLDAIEARAARSAERVNAVERRLEADKSAAKGSAELIAEGQSILRQIRARGQVGD